MTDFPLRPLDQAPLQSYLTNSVQVADLLRWILLQTGPADVCLSSFSLSEEFLRRLFFFEKEGLIRSLDILLDFKATNKTLLLWNFIRQTVRNCYLADNHSKVLLVSNESWQVAAVMSQNLTRGNRYEAAVVSTSPELFASLDQQFRYIISNQSVPFNDIYARTVDGD